MYNGNRIKPGFHQQNQVAEFHYETNRMTNPDNKYYVDVQIPYQPDSNGFSAAVFQQGLTQSVINNPEDYYLAITYFSIPCQNIPLMIPQIQPYPNTDINKTIYSFTLTYDGNISPQTFVEFITEDPSAVVPSSPTQAIPNVKITPYYYVYTYQNFIQMMNDALLDAFNNIPGGAPVGAEAPYFQFDPINERISLVAQQAHYDLNDPSITNPIEIYCNLPMYTYIDGLSEIFFGSNQPNGMDFKIIVRDDKNNWYNPPYLPALVPPAVPEYLIMTQQYPTLVNWNAFKGLAVTSNLLPARQEQTLGNVQGFGTGTSVNVSQQGNVGFVGTLASFEPVISVGPEGHGIVYFTQQGPYHLIDMNGKVPIQTLDLAIQWYDVYGNFYPLDIPFNQIARIKIAFFKKETFTS